MRDPTLNDGRFENFHGEVEACGVGDCRYAFHRPEKAKCDGWWTHSSLGRDGLRRYAHWPCPRRVQSRDGDRIAAARVPMLMREKTFDTFEGDLLNGTAIAASLRVAEGNLRNLVLAGGVGVGKTHLASAIVNHELNRGERATFVTVPALLGDLRGAVKKEKLEDMLVSLISTPLLVLDDLGAERGTDFAREQLFLIVNGRLMEQRRTVVTTNFRTPAALIARLEDLSGERIVSRLLEGGEWVQVNGEDRRLR